MTDDGKIREYILGLRHELSKVKPSRETALAWEKLDELQQTLWQVGIEVRGSEGLVVDPATMRERAKNALFEMGSDTRGANAIITHLVNRGIIDLETWRPA